MTHRPPLAALVAAALCPGVLAWLPACQSTPAPLGPAALSPALAPAGEGYLSSLHAITAALAGARDERSATTAAATLREQLPTLNQSMDVLGGLQGEPRESITRSLGTKIARANKAFRAQADRLARDPAASAPLAGLVEQVRLFE